MPNRLAQRGTPAAGPGRREQDDAAALLRQRRERVMALVAEGFPARDSRLCELLEQLAAPVLELRELSVAIAAHGPLEKRLLIFCAHRLDVSREGSLRLPEALVLLGREQLRALLLGWAFTGWAAGRLRPSTMAAFWRHSLRTAARAQEIARRVRPEALESAYLGGLLHDVGRLPLLLAAQEALPVRGTPLPATDDEPAAERACFGVDHCEAGRWMALSGNLPGWLSEIIAHHHEPAQATEDRSLVALVAAADRTARHPARGSAREAPVTQDAAVRLALLDRRPAGLAARDRAARSRFLRHAPSWSAQTFFGTS